MIRVIKLIYYKIRFWGHHVSIHNSANIGMNSSFTEYNKIGKNSYFKGVMDRCSYIANNSTIIGKVGKFCSIGSDVQVITGRHPVTGFVSTSPVFYSLGKQTGKSFVKESKFTEFKYADSKKKYPVIIESDVWVGARSSIVGGTTISVGAVILAGSVVTHDIPPYAIVAGIPAKVIKFRFNEEQITRLMQLKWWEKDFNWIVKNRELFLDINNFLNETSTEYSK
ncbi:MAG: CatB-related O-acetyltransferase [Prolixibacteraceae bacterium]